MSTKPKRSGASPQRLNPRSDTAPRVPQPKVRPVQGIELDPQVVVSFVSLAACHGDPELHCGLTIVPPGGAAQTVGATDDVPVHADWLQNQQFQGPAIGAARGSVVTSPDLADDVRWPDFGRLCVASLDVRSMIAVEAPLDRRGRALLSFYSRDPEVLEGLDLDAALRLTPMIASSARACLDRHDEALRAASDVDFSRTAVALAIVMSHEALSPADAFNRLRDASRQSGLPLVEVALEVLASGKLPGEVPAASVVAGRQRLVGGPEMWRDAGSGPAA